MHGRIAQALQSAIRPAGSRFPTAVRAARSEVGRSPSAADATLGGRRRKPELSLRAPVWVCVPTYNEVANVEPLTTSLLRVLDDARLDAHVLIVDDDSPDGTGAVADRLAAGHERVHVLHRPRKEGLGRAYLDAFRHVLEHGAGLVVEMDADFSHDPRMVPTLVAATTSADLVLGSRYVEGGGVEGWSVARSLISRGGCWYARSVLGLPLRDLTGGFKCFRRPLLETLLGEPLAASGYGFQIETTARAVADGYAVAEVPIRFGERVAGSSKMSWRIVVEAARLVPRLRRTLAVGGPCSGEHAGAASAQLCWAAVVDRARSRRIARAGVRFARPPRQIVFAAVGVTVAAIGALVLAALVELAHVNPHPAYLVQALLSIELNFALSHLVTWGDRRATGSSAGPAWLKFHATRAFTIPLNQLLFSGLVVAGCHYMLANGICIAAAATLNYVASDRWVFSRSRGAGR